MKNIILTFFIATFLLSCAKDIKKGTQINVSGFVIDTVKNKNLPFAKVYLVGCKNNFSGSTFCYDFLDSSTTDINGNFTINYRAEGNSVRYVLEVANDNNYGNNLYQQLYFNNNSTNVRLKSQELNFLKLNLKVDFNLYDTVYLFPSHGLSKRLVGRSLDTTIYLKVIPNNKNTLQYCITALGRDTSVIIRRATDTLNIGLADTTNYSKRIYSTYQIPLSGF
ncbi:MAG: hypothetical protein WBC06_12605 [Chitinophagaceae bacterium]